MEAKRMRRMMVFVTSLSSTVASSPLCPVTVETCRTTLRHQHLKKRAIPDRTTDVTCEERSSRSEVPAHAVSECHIRYCSDGSPLVALLSKTGK